MYGAPYWFTAEDKAHPVYCTACRKHIPRLFAQAYDGLCADCADRMGVQAGRPTSTITPQWSPEPTPPAPVHLAESIPLVAKPEAKALVEKPAKKFPAAVVVALLILVGLAIGVSRGLLAPTIPAIWK